MIGKSSQIIFIFWDLWLSLHLIKSWKIYQLVNYSFQELPGNELWYDFQANKSSWISVLQFAEGVKNKPLLGERR